MLEKEKLQELLKVWQQMPRNNAQELQVADKYFDEVLMPLSRELFIAREGSRNKRYDAMLLTLGTSWEPLALSLAALRPNKALVLGTEGTLRLTEQIRCFVGREELELSEAAVDRSSAESVYRACNEYLKALPEGACICVDITGGTKAMASALAMYAATHSFDIYYVESKYLPLYRHPEPGSEELKVLERPE